MSAEEFTDTVFAKIDINGDGEGARGMAREGQVRRRRGVFCWSPPLPTSALAQDWILGIPAPDLGFRIPLSLPPELALSPHFAKIQL